MNKLFNDKEAYALIDAALVEILSKTDSFYWSIVLEDLEHFCNHAKDNHISGPSDMNMESYLRGLKNDK